MKIIDAHSHLWLKQDTSWNGQEIRTLKENGSRSMFLGEERQMLPPFMIDGSNSAEVFLSNMDYARVGAAVVVQDMIDGIQNDYLRSVQEKWPERFFCYAMADYLHEGFYEQAVNLLENGRFRGLSIPAHRLQGISLASPEMMRMFHYMEENGRYLSIMLKDGDGQVAELQEVIEECPGLHIAVGHLCMAAPPDTAPWENPSWKRQIALARHENVMIESGGITSLYNSEFYPFPTAVRAIMEAAEIVGWKKLMWGSCYPRTVTAITYRMSYDFLMRPGGPGEEELNLFLGENAVLFYGFGQLPELPYIRNMSE